MVGSLRFYFYPVVGNAEKNVPPVRWTRSEVCRFAGGARLAGLWRCPPMIVTEQARPAVPRPVRDSCGVSSRPTAARRRPCRVFPVGPSDSLSFLFLRMLRMHLRGKPRQLALGYALLALESRPLGTYLSSVCLPMGSGSLVRIRVMFTALARGGFNIRPFYF